MFNPEKLLGGMLRSGRRGGGLGSLVSGGAALGLVGVAMEAAEHFMNKSQSTSQTGPPATPPPGPGGSPKAATGGTPPPPPPLSSGSSSTPPAVPELVVGSDQNTDAILLIRAMIAAANADGVIDADERANILDKLKSVDLSQEEHAFIVHELLAPKPVQELLGEVQTAEMAQQVYTASLLAIEADTEAERRYLSELARQLNLDDHTLNEIHQRLGVQEP